MCLKNRPAPFLKTLTVHKKLAGCGSYLIPPRYGIFLGIIFCYAEWCTIGINGFWSFNDNRSIRNNPIIVPLKPCWVYVVILASRHPLSSFSDKHTPICFATVCYLRKRFTVLPKELYFTPTSHTSVSLL